jgi:putative transposase
MLLQRLPGYVPAGPPKAEQLLKITEFEPRLHHFLIKEYHQRVHGTFRKTPLASWKDPGFLPRMPDSLRQLDLLLLQVHKPRKMHRDGIHFQGLVYLSARLAPLVGKPVSIRYDPRDLRQVRVFYNDKFCCEAVCLELDGEKVSLKEVIRARRRHKRELREKIESRKSLVDAILMEKAFTKPLSLSKDKSKKPISKHTLKLYESDQ